MESQENSTENWNSLSLQLHLRCFEMNYKYRTDYWVYNKPVALFYYLNPVLECLIKQDLEGSIFHHPINAELLKIPDYHDIIKYPMDLSTIRNKLHSGQYNNGWEFVDDVWLMFENAWLYNKKSTRVYKYCSKLAELFKSEIEQPMRRLGYCCGQNYKLEPKILLCNIKNCSIPKLASYWSYKDKYQMCQTCYSEIQSSFVVFQSSIETVKISKEEFVKICNEAKKELFVQCFNCGIKRHKICIPFLEYIWRDGFLCNTCLALLGKKIVCNNFTSANLQQTKLGTHIEERVNNFIHTNGCSSKVIVRLVNNDKMSVQVKKGAKARFVDTGIWPDSFPYTAKTLLAFQEIEGKDICFFAMFVQEYDSECPQPNTRRVYISYLDSVKFFNPKELRTSVYHEILLGYLDYVRNMGFITAHLWSCPSQEGEGYVFYCHPKEQKIPTVKKLVEWYKVMLNKGIKEGIVKEYKDIYRQAIDDSIKNIFELPYFEGDILPDSLESEISEIDGGVDNKVSCNSRKKSALSLMQEENNIHDVEDENPPRKYKKTNKKMKRPKYYHSSVEDLLTNKILQFLLKFREVFLVIHLNHNLSMSELPAIKDPDPLIPSRLLCSREVFLEFCRENDNMFSTVRLAKYSTMVLLYEIYKEGLETFCCNQCKKILETGFHCTVCKDFDLCVNCYYLTGHDHEMETLNVNPDLKSYICFQDYMNEYCKTYVNIVNHLSCCNDSNCPLVDCFRWKILLLHYEMCRKGRYCRLCYRSFHLVIRHSKSCKNLNCQIEMCKNIKSFKLNSSLNSKNDQVCAIAAD